MLFCQRTICDTLRCQRAAMLPLERAMRGSARHICRLPLFTHHTLILSHFDDLLILRRFDTRHAATCYLYATLRHEAYIYAAFADATPCR